MTRAKRFAFEERMALRGLVKDTIAHRDALVIVETVKKLSGIHVDPKNQGFLELRVSRRMRELSISRTEDYVARLNGPQGAQEAQHLVETIATHTTDFFREKGHFDFLRTTGLPELMKLGAGKEWPLLVWSAACSIGSELWTAGIVLDRFSMTIPGGMRWALMGTDVSRRVLMRAANALFTQDELSGLDEETRRAYLLRSKPGARIAASGTVFRIVPDLRRKASFKWANLVDISPEFETRADVIFLRNVLIYFDQADKEAAIGNVLRHLRPGGYLITGHAEAISPKPAGLTQVAPSVYRKAQQDE